MNNWQVSRSTQWEGPLNENLYSIGLSQRGTGFQGYINITRLTRRQSALSAKGEIILIKWGPEPFDFSFLAKKHQPHHVHHEVPWEEGHQLGAECRP